MTVLEALAARAFSTASPAQANDAIEAAREARGSASFPAVSYEVLVPALDAERALTHRVLPRLVNYLDCHGAKLPRAAGYFVSLFAGAALHFIDAADVVEVLAAARGLPVEELVRRYGERGVGDPPLLGP